MSINKFISKDLETLPILYRFVKNEFSNSTDYYYHHTTKDKLSQCINNIIFKNIMQHFFNFTKIKHTTYTSLQPTWHILKDYKYFIVIPLEKHFVFQNKYFTDLITTNQYEIINIIKDKLSLNFIAYALDYNFRNNHMSINKDCRRSPNSKKYLSKIDNDKSIIGLWEQMEQLDPRAIDIVSESLINSYTENITKNYHVGEVLLYTSKYLLFDFQNYFNSKYGKDEDHKYWYQYFEDEKINTYFDLINIYERDL